MTAPMDAVITVPRQNLDPERLAEIAAAAADRIGSDYPIHLTRYPSDCTGYHPTYRANADPVGG